MKVKSGGMTQIRKAYVQSLNRDDENLLMDEDDLILDFFGKLYYMVNELRNLGEMISNIDVASKLL